MMASATRRRQKVPQIAQWIFLLLLTSTNGGDGVTGTLDIHSVRGCLLPTLDSWIIPDLALKLKFTSNKIVVVYQT